MTHIGSIAQNISLFDTKCITDNLKLNRKLKRNIYEITCTKFQLPKTKFFTSTFRNSKFLVFDSS